MSGVIKCVIRVNEELDDALYAQLAGISPRLRAERVRRLAEGAARAQEGRPTLLEEIESAPKETKKAAKKAKAKRVKEEAVDAEVVETTVEAAETKVIAEVPATSAEQAGEEEKDGPLSMSEFGDAILGVGSFTA